MSTNLIKHLQDIFLHRTTIANGKVYIDCVDHIVEEQILAYNLQIQYDVDVHI